MAKRLRLAEAVIDKNLARCAELTFDGMLICVNVSGARPRTPDPRPVRSASNSPKSFPQGIPMTSKSLGFAATAVASVIMASAAFAQTYTYVTVDPPGTSAFPGAQATSINAAGEIVGSYSDSSGISHGFLYRKGTFTTIDFPGGINAAALSINDRRDIVGSYTTSDGRGHGFLYRDDTYTTIDPPGSISTPIGNCGNCSGQYINASGRIIGTYTDGSFVDHFFLYDRGTYATIDPPGAEANPREDLGRVSSINARGQIVGEYVQGSSSSSTIVVHGFLYDRGTYTFIDVSSYKNFPVSINNSGQIAGYATFTSPTTTRIHGFIYDRGTYTLIDPPANLGDTFTASINERGQVAGSYDGLDGNSHGFLYDSGAYTIIDFPGASQTYPLSMNDSGQIVGLYVDGIGNQQTLHGFLASPPAHSH
jgi:hypothetical protein